MRDRAHLRTSKTGGNCEIPHATERGQTLCAGDLKRVDLVLPPPARLDARAAEGTLPRATQRALGRLLEACGLEADFAGAALSTQSRRVG